MPAANALAARNALGKKQAQAAIAVLRLGDSELVWPLFRHSADPTLRSYLIRDVGASGVSPEPIVMRLEVEPDVSARRALILTLAGFSTDQLPLERRNPVIARLLRLYQQDPDAGVHSAIDWLLRYGRQGLMERKLDWGQSEILARIDRELAGKPIQNQNWFVSKSGHTFAVMQGPVEFTMGAPLYEPGREKTDEPPHSVRIPRSFAIAVKEVTVGQFQLFLDANRAIKKRAQAAGKKDPTRDGQIMRRLNVTDDCPQILMTWFEAAQYCNWLSQQEGIPEQEWCYPALEQITEGMILPTNHLHRTGYRLPTIHHSLNTNHRVGAFVR